MKKVALLIKELQFDKKCLEKAMPVHDSRNFAPEVTVNNPDLAVCKSRAPVSPKLPDEILLKIENQKRLDNDKFLKHIKLADEFGDQGEK